MKKAIVYVLIVLPLMLFGCASNSSDTTETQSEEARNESLQESVQPAEATSGDQAITDHQSANDPSKPDGDKPAKVYPDKGVELTTAEFKKLVYDMDKHPNEWVYNGDLPAIVDFYAVWCGPCKMAAPGLEELAKEYSGKVYIYKVDAEKERFLSNYFRVTGYPSFLLIPAKGQPRMFAGLPPGVRGQSDIKPAFKKIIENELL